MKKTSYPYKLGKKIYKQFVFILSGVSPVLATKVIYFRVFKRRLNLNHPQSLCEKILYLKLKDYYNNPLITQCADKYKVREYVKSKGLEYILNDLILVTNDPYSIDYDKLPQRFVMKCNHSSGANIICTDKDALNIVETNKTLEMWLKEDYWREYAETNYKFIPRKIVVEPFLGDTIDEFPTDYRIMCFNGSPEFLYLTTWTSHTEKLSRIYLDKYWKPLDIGETMTLDIPRKPDNLVEMLEIAKILSADFKFVRVDLFNCNGKIYFGELTFTPTGGLTKDFDNEYVNNLLVI